MALDTKPARTDLTDRECAKLLGAVIAGLCQMAPSEAVRAAVRWWAETDAAWEMVPKSEEEAWAWAKRLRT